MKKILLKLFAFLFITLFFAQSSFSAEKYHLILFYADWNVYSQKAIDTLKGISENSQNISFEKINIDNPTAFIRIKQLGVMPTKTIPYYFLTDKSNKILYGSNYKNEDAKVITDILNDRINRD